MSGSCFFHEPLTGSAEIGPAGPLRLRGDWLIWVSLRSDALLRPLAQARLLALPPVSAQPDVVVAPLDAVAERPGVVGLPLSARFVCVQEQVDVLALQPASRLQA